MEKSSQHLPQGTEEFTKTGDALFPTRRNTTESHILKPLLIGCLTGQLHALLAYLHGSLTAHFIESFGDPVLKKRLPDLKMANLRRLRISAVFGATYTPASLGLFEILTEKLRTNSNGRPLSLCEEASCGLTCGATAALVTYPFHSAYATTAPQNLSYGQLFSILHHRVRDKGFSALWKNSGLFIARHITANVGMLASYNRSKKYFMESKDLSEGDAVICAGIISGFFAAACSYPCDYVKAVQGIVQKHYRLGNKHSYREIPLYISRILTPYSGLKFYSNFLGYFGQWALYCVAQRIIFEDIHMLDKSMESSTRFSN